MLNESMDPNRVGLLSKQNDFLKNIDTTKFDFEHNESIVSFGFIDNRMGN